MQLVYFPIRGLGEMIRMALEASGEKYEEVAPNGVDMKNDLDQFHFAQVPKFVDGDLVLCQSQAIMRHLGRKFDLYGSSGAEAGRIDELMDGTHCLRMKYLELIYTHEASDKAKAEHWAKHGDPTSATGARNGGSHWTYLARLVKRGTPGGDGPAVGAKLSIADVAVAELASLYLRLFEGEMTSTYPEIVAHCKWVYDNDGIKAYVASGRRPESVNARPIG